MPRQESKIIIVLLLCMIILPLTLADYQNIIISDNFDDNSINASIWTNEGSCVEQNKEMECLGNDKYIQSVALQNLGFNTSKYYNITFMIRESGTERGAITLMDEDPVLSGSSTNTSARGTLYSGTEDRHGFYTQNTAGADTPMFPQNISAQAGTFITTTTNNISLIYNSSGYFIFINGLLLANTSKPVSNKMLFLGFGDWENDQTGMSMYLDNITFSEIIVGSPPSESPTITLITNLANSNVTRTYSNFSVSATFIGNASDYLYDCYLNISNSINQSIISANLSNTNWFNVTWGLKEVEKNISIKCNYTTINYTTSKYLYQIDTILPDITWNNIGNNSVITRDVDILNFSVTFEDTNLYATNLSIIKLNADGSRNMTINRTNMTEISGISYTLNFSNNRSIDIASAVYKNNYTSGRYMIEATAWDSHTALEIAEYTQEKVADGIIFEEAIKITSPDLVAMETTKQTDRYNFEMEFTTAQPTIYVECNDLRYIPNSQYKGHFVCWEEKKWIDFEDYSGNVEDIKATRLSANKYQLEINPKTLLEKIFDFNSIGDLNNITELYYFNISEGYKFFATDYISNTTISNFTISVNSTPIQTRTATGNNVTFNITSGIYSVNITHPSYVLNSTIVNFTENGTTTFYLTASNSLYLLVYDEITNLQLSGINVSIQVINFANASYDYTTTTGSLFQEGFSEGDYQINYVADGYAFRTYFTTIVGNDTQSIRLYLLNSTPDTHLYKNIEVADESGVPIGSGTFDADGNEITNATIELRRFYTDCNCYRIVEMARTGESGQTFVFAQLYDAIYKIYVDVLGEYKKITPETRFDTRDIYISVNLLTSGVTDFISGTDGFFDLSYNSDSHFITYTWVGSSDVTSGTMAVKRLTSYNEYNIFNQTTDGQSSSITYNLSSLVNTTGTIIIYASTTTDDNNTYLVATKTMDWSNSTDAFGLTGVFLTALIVMIMALVGFYNPVVAVFLSIVGLIGSRFIGLIYIDLGWLLGLVVVAMIYAFKMRT